MLYVSLTGQEPGVCEPGLDVALGPVDDREAPAGGARGRVLVVAGPGRGASREVRGRLVIGRGVSCDLAIPSPSLSRQHAVIEQVGGQFWLVDLGSTNRIEVKGARVQRHLLVHGDQFSVVDTTFRFEQT